ncbi:intestinal mucin-like protein [Poecilia formosa]|uniref:Intestinal mucin-like protein n=1 Tax=Poecilia formosa TaxID=48698 RepID=A0A087Y4A7_POEFO|nr:PREDICTED: intestinal mucin-like protein [Poecilia formosa]
MPNETFHFCNCTMAKCIGNNTVQIVPYECPPRQNITCTNGKKPVLMYDDYHCCQHYVCDCECEGWGDPHYITFDGKYYSYQGNCSYQLMKEIIPTYHLEIQIDNVNCDPTEDVSCPRSLTVIYRTEIIKLINHNLNGPPDLEALKEGVSLRLPYYYQGVKVVSTKLNLILEIPYLGVIIKFGRTGFNILLPYEKFGRNTQGHCGTCTNNQADDCMLPSGEQVSCDKMANHWLLLPSDSKKPGCKTPEPPKTQQSTEPPCQSHPICDLLMSSVFAECHPLVSQSNFYKGCLFDNCHVSNKAVLCNSLETYAAACAEFGVCIHWRNHTKLCASNCDSNKVYKPCGPVEQPTCEEKSTDPSMNYTTEGCFCPDGMKLFSKESDICVKSCGCLDPDKTPREFNETFEYQCQNCVCNEATKTVLCQPKACPIQPAILCKGPGYVLVNITDPSNPCCNIHDCQCQKNACPTSCPVGFEYVQPNSIKGECCGNCVQTHCVISINGTEKLLKPKDEWSPTENNCEHYKCVKNGQILTAVSFRIVCPPFQESNCKNDTIQTLADGCCKTCVTKPCKLETMKTVIKHNGCKSEVVMPYCEGSCNTFFKYSEAANAMENSCSCCKEARASNRTVDLACEGGGTAPFTYMHVEECGCSHTECTAPAEQRVRRKRSFRLL